MHKNPKVLIVLGLAFLLATVIIPVVALMPLLSEPDEAETIIRTPGSAEISIAEPGRYYLWNAYETIHEGTSYSRPDSLPDGLNITINTKSGELLSLTTNTSITFTSGSESKQSVGHIEITEPVDLVITASGTSSEDDARILVFSQSFFAGNLTKVILYVTMTLMCALMAVIFVVWGVIVTAKRRNSSPPPAPIVE